MLNKKRRLQEPPFFLLTLHVRRLGIVSPAPTRGTERSVAALDPSSAGAAAHAAMPGATPPALLDEVHHVRREPGNLSAGVQCNRGRCVLSDRERGRHDEERHQQQAFHEMVHCRLLFMETI